MDIKPGKQALPTPADILASRPKPEGDQSAGTVPTLGSASAAADQAETLREWRKGQIKLQQRRLMGAEAVYDAASEARWDAEHQLNLLAGALHGVHVGAIVFDRFHNRRVRVTRICRSITDTIVLGPRVYGLGLLKDGSVGVREHHVSAQHVVVESDHPATIPPPELPEIISEPHERLIASIMKALSWGGAPVPAPNLDAIRDIAQRSSQADEYTGDHALRDIMQIRVLLEAPDGLKFSDPKKDQKS